MIFDCSLSGTGAYNGVFDLIKFVVVRGNVCGR